ncbi:VIT domain-containing protein [Tahibacter harae]|uniref:VIT domain-containing protein n=1 Tax=Tahibacter harae TaxID=2963937 RepID=A0ABT1QN36_9GAMM|nr:VIT domain-containing protein [Tahibacter harae]MCQ4163936.1 VIT domain-containing protein [Tahibacter harae]
MNTLWKGLTAAVLLQAAAVPAQDVAQIARPRPPQIWLDPALKQQPIQLQDISIDIRIQGFVASTRLDLTFFNPNARVLEGELVFPLAEGQSITGYALEVEGKLRQGVMVEKETARVAYESTVRQGIDPGLAELTQGNVFRTRLYPLPPNGSKRVQIAFDQPLLDVGANYRYLLPLQFAEPIKHFKVRAEALRAEVAPAGGGAALSFDRWRDSFVAELEKRDFRPQTELSFDLPKPKDAVSIYSVRDALEPAWRHFAAQVQSGPDANVKPAAAPRRITLYYDASGSAAGRDRARELDFLAAWLGQLGSAEIDLIAFRNEADAPRHFAIRNGDAQELRQAIEALPLDGASAYGTLRLDATARPDFVLVIGDGLNNFGSGEPQFRNDAVTPRLAFLHAAQTVDSPRLARWSRRHGGQVVNLLASPQAEALRQLAAPRWALLATQVLKGECQELAPAAPQPAGASFSLYGRCSADAELQLEFGDGAGNRILRTLRPGAGEMLEAGRGEFVQRLWATARIADLENEEFRNKDAIVELSKKYGVVTQDTSMLVLDRIEDYVRHKVEPREAELAAQYRELLARQPKQAGADVERLQHREQVLGWWSEFRKWHGQRHPWLETVLAPSAAAEVARWEQLPQLKDHVRNLAAVRKLASQAGQLEKRWSKEGAGAESRKAWEREASGLMLELDALRQLRLAEAPDSDALKQRQAQISDAGGGRPPEGRLLRQRAPRPEPQADAPAIVVEEAAPMAMAAPPAPAGAGGSDPLRQAGAVPKIAREAGADDRRSAPTGIELKDWDPNTPYLARLRAARDPYAAYLEERAQQAKTPAFFLDCADFFRREAKDERLALRVLSNLAEIDFDSAPLLRVLAYRLQQWERFDLAVPLFEQALKLRGEEPQSRRDLALALSRQANPDYNRAVTLLWEVVDRRWDGRFPEIEIIALHELNDIVSRASGAARMALDGQIETLGIDSRLLEHQPVDLRVALTWDADNTDIDLWVVDPTGEVAIYSHPRTRSGGHMSRDFTGGYGPEVFTIRRAIPGTYVVKTHYFSDRQQKITGAVTLQLEFLTRFDSGGSKRQATTRRLEDVKGEIEIGRFTVGAE